MPVVARLRGLPGPLKNAVRRRTGRGADRGGAVVRAGDRGASAIEFVALTPVMFFMIFAAVQFAMYSFAEDVAKASAQAGARIARAEADDSEARPGEWQQRAEEAASERVRQLGPGLFTAPPQVEASLAGSEDVRVEVRGSVPAILPGMNLTVHAVSQGPIERFRPDDGG